MEKLIEAVHELLENRSEDYFHPLDRNMLIEALEAAEKESEL